MKKLRLFVRWTFFLLLFLIFIMGGKLFSQTAFTAPVISTQTGSSNSFNALVVGPETVGAGCAEMGQTWTHNFNGTADRRLNGFTITSTSYYVNNFGSLSTVLRRNNSSGASNIPPASCATSTAIPWNDRQIVFFEGTRDLTTNVASIVNSFPSTTLPGTAGYDAVNEMNIVFSKGLINSGADNIFNNLSGTGAGYNSNANNIERMDLFVSGGVNVTATNMTRTGIVIVCRGPSDDPFVLSAIKGLTGGSNIGGGSNYVYDDIIKINAGWTSKTINGGGAIGIVAAQRVTLLSGITTVVLRRMDSTTALNDLLPTASYPTASSYVAAQNIVAMFFTFADLGLAAGDVFYGYSVAGFDVTAVNSNQFNSYLNSTYFPLNTNPADGGVDLTGFPGLFAPVDIDDDDDGLPDYLEANLSLAFGDHDTDGILNYCDTGYPAYVDNNADGINDNFDPSADSDNDGTPNYRDTGFPGYVDTNSDSVNDNFDWDLDGIPNHLDRDSDNDGIPDVVESYGVDANGDGIVDNYTDTDVDGLSQNVDGNSTGAVSSGVGLGAIDTDGDGVPNYLDHDSDNDGIPDIIEAYGTDTNNNAVIDSYSDSDGDGYSDNIDGDVGNDNFAENSAACLLRTGSDGNSDGRTDSYPYKNIDADSKPNPYDLDSDGDGITDVKEAQFTDANWDGRVDGAVNTYGRNVALAALGSLTIPNTDGVGSTNPYDIDSDNDGIPDNVEGQTTAGYLIPSATDTDGDGIVNTYDNFNGFGGDGIHPVNTDGDPLPDYLDDDTDGDGLIDLIEGNDLNLNGLRDDNVTLTGTDTDGDGLDDRFDNINGSHKGTSGRMGNGGTTSGDPTPGSITTVQRSPAADGVGCTFERDWRCIPYVLSCDIISFKAVLTNNITQLEWKVLCRQEAEYFEIERSIDGYNFQNVQRVKGRIIINEIETYTTTDNIAAINAPVIYYRLKTVVKNGRTSFSNIIAVNPGGLFTSVQLYPNPAKNYLQIIVNCTVSENARLLIRDALGKTILRFNEILQTGNNTYSYNIDALSSGLYYLRIDTRNENKIFKFSVLK